MSNYLQSPREEKDDMDGGKYRIEKTYSVPHSQNPFQNFK